MKKHAEFSPRRPRNGFTLIEVTIAMMIFLMMVLMFAAVFPIAVRGSIFSNNYAQAVALSQHKMDQLRQEGFTNLSNPSSVLVNDSVIDSPLPTQPASGYLYHFTNADNLTSYFPSGSTGTITVNSFQSSSTVYDVAVEINWTMSGGAQSSYTLHALIVKNEPNQN